MKKVRAAAVIAVVTTVVSQARDYAREHPDQAAQTVDQVERFLRGKAALEARGVRRQGGRGPAAGPRAAAAVRPAGLLVPRVPPG